MVEVVEVMWMRADRTNRTRIVAAVVACTMLAATAAPGWADDYGADRKRAGVDFGMGVATVGANLFYMPVKLCYALLGGVTGGLAFGLTGGNREVADRIWIPSMAGDYVLNPDQVAGREQIYFSGLRNVPPASARAAQQPPPAAGAASGNGTAAPSPAAEDDYF